MRADPSVYKIEDPRLGADSNLPTAQSIEGEFEVGDTNSSLLSSSDAMESAYSKLEG